MLRGAPCWPRGRRALGHGVRLMPPEYVRPYLKAQKNDDRDAEAIAEAATRPTMRFVPLKAQAQLDVQALHRAQRAAGGGTDGADQPAACPAAGARHCAAAALPAPAAGSSAARGGRA